MDKQISTAINHYEDYKFTCVFKFIKTKSVIINNYDNMIGDKAITDTGSIIAFAYCNTNLTWLNSTINLYAHNPSGIIETNPLTYDNCLNSNYALYKTSLLNYAAGNSNISHNFITGNNNINIIHQSESSEIILEDILSGLTDDIDKIRRVNTGFISFGYAQIRFNI